MSASASISMLRLAGLGPNVALPGTVIATALILYLASAAAWRHAFFKGSEPTAFRRRLGLESFDFRSLLQGQADVVETV